jgi:alkylation response protein AidB-like acyl-CoA dehydrogenase
VCVEAAAQATYLLVTAVDAETDSYYLVTTNTAGVSIEPLVGLDGKRRYARVTLIDTPVARTDRVGHPGLAATGTDWLIDIAATLYATEVVGAVKHAVDITLSWVSNRYSFGRPLSSYQEIKHRMADMRTTLQACAAICERAARALGRRSGDASALASAAMAYVGTHGPEVIQDCIQLHGGIGVTAECDLHLLLRRAIVAANGLAAPTDFAQRLVAVIDAADRERDVS